MSPSIDDKLTASVFALGLLLGFVRREDIVAWADRRIAELDHAPEWLINLSLSQNQHLLELISELNRIATGFDPAMTCKASFALIPDIHNCSFDEAEELAKFVYRIAKQALNGDWQNSLLCEADSIADTFSYVRNRCTELNEQQAIDQFFKFIQRHRNDGFAQSIRPVGWSFRSQLGHGIIRDNKERLLTIGLSAWIIQDGNYNDFSVGDTPLFALEFHPIDKLQPTTGHASFIELVAASRYRICARIIFIGPEVWVIDTGTFVAYQAQRPPAFAVVGTRVEGVVYIGIDPFFYFEELCRLEDMPALSYTWRVRQILREITPWLEKSDAKGRKCFERDKTKEAYLPTHETKAWTADNGNAHYLLVCQRIAGPEKPIDRPS